MRYEGYSSFSEVIKWFWELVESFSEKDKQTLLYFLTGTHKVPLGLKNYDLTIERVHDTSRLPVAHTWYQPPYPASIPWIYPSTPRGPCS